MEILPIEEQENEEYMTQKSLKPIKVLLSVTVLCCLLTMLTACHKTCICTRYDGAEDKYSADEVDDRGVTCANMVFQAGVQYYSVCDWE